MACGTCTLIFFIFCNVIICLIGIPLVVFGALSFIWRDWFWQHVEQITQPVADEQNLLRDQWDNIGIVLIVVGAVCIIVSWIGCAAAGVRSRGLLGCYLVMLFMAFGVSIAFAIIVVYGWITEREEIPITEKFKTWEFFTGDDLTDNGRYWNKIQQKYECCGINGPDDYKESTLNKLGLPVLPSCCKLEAWDNFNLTLSETKMSNDNEWKQCKEEAKNANEDSDPKILYKKGCLMPELVVIVFGLLFGFAGFMFFTFLVGMCFCCCINKDDDIV